MKVTDIADCLGRDSRTIARWIRDFKEMRLASMFTQQKGNQHASKLTPTQKEEIKLVLNHKPSDFGLPKEFWDVPQLKTYVYANFGVVYESDRSYHFLLEFGNLSFKESDKFRIERNEKFIAQRMEEIYEEIIPFLEDPHCEVFCSDETRILFQALTRRAWLKKGEKTVIKVEKKDQYQNYLGFLNQRTFKCYVLPISWGKAPEIIRATTEFLKLYQGKKIVIIWDNATHHKGKLFQHALSRGGPLERVHLIPLPPYAPDTNPIEHVWNTTKEKLANNQERDFEVTKKKFMQLTDQLIFPYQI